MRPLRLTNTNRAAGTAGQQQVKSYASALQTLASKATKQHTVRYSSSRGRLGIPGAPSNGVASLRAVGASPGTAQQPCTGTTAAPTALTFLTAWMRASDNKP